MTQPQRMSFESRLRKETPRWVVAGAVTAEQARQIEALHPENEGAAGRRFLTIVTALGGALCAVGLALIISANWQDIHRWVKIGVFVALLVSAYAFGAWLKDGPRQMPKVGEALLMLGCVMLMLGIALVSQIFNLSGRPGDAVLIWIVGIAAVPLLTRARGTFFVLLVAVYAWVCIEASASDGWLIIDTPKHLNGEHSLPFAVLCVSLVFFWTASLWTAAYRRFADMQEPWALAGVCFMVYAASFLHETWRSGQNVLAGHSALGFIGLATLAAAVAARRDFTRWRQLSPWLLLAAVPAWIALGGFFGPDARVACAWLSSTTLLALNVFMARAGLRQGEPWLVNLGIAFIALNIFTCYFDFFSSMLDQGMMFLVSGVVVLGLGWFLERKRRALLGAIKSGGVL